MDSLWIAFILRMGYNMNTRFLNMESTMDAIETRLRRGDTPKQLIVDGFKKSTVYKVAKKLESKGGLGMDDRTAYLARLIREIYMDLSVELHEVIGDDFTYDPDKAWKEVVKTANEIWTDETETRPPQIPFIP